MQKTGKFILKEAVGSNLLVPFGEKQITFSGIITLNDSAKFLWEKVDGEFTREDLISYLCEEYKIEEDVAAKSADKFINILKEVGAIE